MINSLTLLLSAVMLNGGTAPAPKAPPVVEVHAKDFSYNNPKTVQSGPVTFRLVNDGKEMHHLSIIKLGSGKTMKDVEAAMKKQGPPPGWMIDMGGPNAAIPGATIEATVNLTPGEYALMCFIPSPGSPMPHMAKGMVSSITVLPASNGASMPAADVTVTLSDYTFKLSKPFSHGKQVVSVVNTASQSHEVVFVKLSPGKKVADLSAWVEKDMMKGPPPGLPMAGMSGIAKGQSASFVADLSPGTYGLICFVPDSKDGKSHSMHGMMTQFDVK
ncbi:MAG: hypothetical protein ABIY52_02470 [Gemmatimonadaceae bacterium]